MSRLVVPIATIVVMSCGDATPPDRPAPYQFSIDCTDPSLGCAADAPPLLTFNWPLRALPLRVWVQPGSELSRPIADGLRLWIGAGLYGELRAAFVSDSLDADVMVLRMDPVQVPRGTEAPLDCEGRTPIAVAADTTIVLPFRVLISPRLGARPEEIERCFQIVTAHELGHTLGLLLHSDDPADLMHRHPTVEALSLRDRASFTTLYHSNPTVGIPVGR